MKLEPGTHIGRYELEELLGRGAMGEVWRARSLESGCKVALKRAHPHNPLLNARLAREGRLQGDLRSPNIVEIIDIFTVEGASCVVMEYVEGPSLYQFLRKRSRSFAEAEEIAEGIFNGIAVAHNAGTLHRDLKPGNVMLHDAFGHWIPKLADFGLARGEARLPDEPALTKTGFILGTPGYMAPEQIREASTVDARADIFAFGAILYQLYTGQRAFRGADSFELMRRTCAGEFISPSETEANPPSRIVNTIEAALAPRPERRPPDIQTLRAIWVGDAEGKDYGRSLRRRALALGPTEAYVASTDTVGSHAVSAAPPIDNQSHITPVGRDAAVDEIIALLDEFPVVTLVGAGGIGKTCLAKWICMRKRHLATKETFFCDLTSSVTRDGVIGAVSTTLQVPLVEADAGLQLSRAIAGRDSLLLVLDNTEQVIGDLAPLLSEWLVAAPNARFLITSRIALSIDGEAQFNTPPLTTRAAIALFEKRALVERPGYTFSEVDKSTIREIVDQLEGMPLAIELAAARTGLLSLSQLRERLADGLRLLHIDAPGKPIRTLSMRASIDASWALLQPWEKLALCQVSVFRGGFVIDAAEVTLDLEHWPETPWVMDVIHSLIRHSLIRAVTSPGGERRLTLFESIRQYAAEKMSTDGIIEGPNGESLTGSGPLDELRERHAKCYAESSFALIPQSRHEVTMRSALNKLQVERDNIEAALNTGVARSFSDVAEKSACSLIVLCLRQGPIPQGVVWVERALSVVKEGTESYANLVTHWLCLIDESKMDISELGPQFTKILSLPDTAEFNDAKAWLHSVLCFSADSPLSPREHVQEAVRRARLSPDRNVQASIFTIAAIAYIRSGDLKEGYQLTTEAMNRFRDARNMDGQVKCLNTMGAYFMQKGDLLRASTCRQEALAIAQAFQNTLYESRLLMNLGSHDYQRGDFESAITRFQSALTKSRATGSMITTTISLENLGECYLALQDYQKAERYLREALNHNQNQNAGLIVLSPLALTYARQGKFELARQSLRELAMSPGTLNVFEMSKATARRAEIEFLDGKIDVAHQAIKEAESLCDEHGFGPDSEAYQLINATKRIINGS